jgi:hypothetical protein
MKKRDWAFVVASLAGAVLFGVWSVRVGVQFYRSQHAPTEFASSQRLQREAGPELQGR